MIAEKWLSL
jgi:hypothetical protein